MGERNLLILNLLIAAMLTAVYLYSHEVGPKRISIEDSSKNIGNYVSMEGIVWKRTVADGKTHITLTDNFRESIDVFAKFKARVYPGMRISVKGLIVRYGSTVELQVSNPEDLHIISSRYITSLPVIMENPENFTGLNVEFEGRVDYEKITYLNLSDATGFIKAIVTGGYEGEREAYFTGTVNEGKFTVFSASSKPAPDMRVLNISEAKNQEGKRVCIHARIYDYGLYIIVRDENYSVRVYAEVPEIPEGIVQVTGVFYYLSERGEYVVYARNVK